MRSGLAPTLVATFLAVSGCGGGSSSPPAHPLYTKLLIYAPGDTWTYSLQGKEQNVLFGNFTLSGTETTVVTLGQINGAPVQVFTVTDRLNVSGQTGTEQTVYYQTQSATTGDVTYIADDQGANGAIRIVTDPQVTSGGTFKTGAPSTIKLDFNNGDKETLTGQVLGTSQASAAAGAFNCWKTHGTMVDTNGSSDITTSWYAPQLGSAVYSQISAQVPGISLQFTRSLISTNIPLG